MHAYLFPGLDVVGLAGHVRRTLQFAELDESTRQLRVVADAVVENLGGLEQALREAAVTHFLETRVARLDGVVAQHRQAARLCVREAELRLNEGLTDPFAGHLQVSDELLPISSVGALPDDFTALSRIAGFDEGVDRLPDQASLQLGFRKSRPHRLLVDALREVVGASHITHVLDEDLDCGRVDVELPEEKVRHGVSGQD